MMEKLLISEKGKKLIVKGDKDINTDKGIIRKDDIKKAKIGEHISTHKGEKYIVLKPNFVDYYEKMKRGPQIIMLKDAGIISAYTGLCSGMIVLDAGIGSGALTAYMANLVKPKGKVYAYEVRNDFIKIAKENLKKMGLLKYVVIKKKDVCESIDEKVLDLVTLDIPEPRKALKHVERALKPGGFLVCYLPTIMQVSATCNELENTKMKIVKIIEIIERPWIVKEKAVRPKTMILGHTGFLIFARKLQK